MVVTIIKLIAGISIYDYWNDFYFCFVVFRFTSCL